MDTTGKAFVEHWNWAAAKGLMNRHTASSLAGACYHVIRVHEDWEALDVTKIDADETVRRFTNLRHNDFKPRSLDAYGKRFKSALVSFLDYVHDPAAWKPQQRATRAIKKVSDQKSGSSGDSISATSDGASSVGAKASISPQARDDVGDYQFPLRRNLSARLILPRDLQEGEAKRLQAFISLLVTPDEEKEERDERDQPG